MTGALWVLVTNLAAVETTALLAEYITNVLTGWRTIIREQVGGIIIVIDRLRKLSRVRGSRGGRNRSLNRAQYVLRGCIFMCDSFNMIANQHT